LCGAGFDIIVGESANSGVIAKMEPEQNHFAAEPSRQVRFGKIAAIFLIIGPPSFGALFWLTVSLANPVGDPLHEKIGEALGVAFSFFGLLASYAVGLLPSLVIGFAYSRSRRYVSAIRHRFGIGALIGAAVYYLPFVVVVLDMPNNGDRIKMTCSFSPFMRPVQARSRLSFVLSFLKCCSRSCTSTLTLGFRRSLKSS
jgi:hypothetical protein